MLRRLLQLATLSALATIATGCSTASYLWQAGVGQLSIYSHERSLQEVIDDPRTSEEVRTKLRWIPEIKKVVEEELGVKATSNYTTYVKLDRPYVTWSLTAAEPYEIRLVTWSFPFFGAFPYLGFFKESTAKDWAKDYQEKGYDTYVRGVQAYSTLGYLRDPFLSSMLSREKADLVNLIYHETTHGQIYIHSFVDFNEQIASFIGDEGERVWLEKTYGKNGKELKDWEADRADRRRFGKLLRQFADELKTFYAGSVALPADERKRQKDVRFAAFRRQLESEQWTGRGYGRAGRLITNNAALLAFLTYEDDQPLFDSLNEKCGGRPRDALRYLKSLERDWDRLRSAQPSLRPQDLLRTRLEARDARGGVCLDLHGQ